jgi:hypothetical protein
METPTMNCRTVALLVALLATGLVRGGELEQALTLARQTLDFVQRSRPCPDLAAKLGELEERSARGQPLTDTARTELCSAARQLRRRIIFSHPLLDFDRLLVNKRPPPAYSHQSRQYLGRYSRPGPGLVVLEDWKARPRESLLLQGRLPRGTVMHPDLSHDARRVAFAFCDHTPTDPNVRQFFLWEIGADGRGLRQLTGKPADRTAGADGRQTALIEDFDRCYLPDGGIAFVSTRTQTHIRCQYGGRYFANFLLYRADGDGANIRPLSFAEAPEWEPSVLDDGRILYTRWDYTNRQSADVVGSAAPSHSRTYTPHLAPGNPPSLPTESSHECALEPSRSVLPAGPARLAAVGRGRGKAAAQHPADRRR